MQNTATALLQPGKSQKEEKESQFEQHLSSSFTSPCFGSSRARACSLCERERGVRKMVFWCCCGRRKQGRTRKSKTRRSGSAAKSHSGLGEHQLREGIGRVSNTASFRGRHLLMQDSDVSEPEGLQGTTKCCDERGLSPSTLLTSNPPT